MPPYLIGVFLLLSLGAGLLLATGTGQKQKHSQRRFRMQGKLIGKLERLLDRGRELIRGSGFPLPTSL